MVTANQIREHMEVKAADGRHVGTVDHMEGDSRIKLTRNDSDDGQHHLIPLDWVDHVDSHVHLNKDAEDVKREWSSINGPRSSQKTREARRKAGFPYVDDGTILARIAAASPQRQKIARQRRGALAKTQARPLSGIDLAGRNRLPR